ncbi:MAG: hypothetical protein JNM09_28465 [Blastocatellia bacterium]|nr:hypothetical protein [Blastocatellia bacterium]
MNRLINENPYITFGILFSFALTLAVIGIAAEVVFVISHLELIARQISLLTVGGISN